MQAHPIPQNVVSFEDRIFGPLTAKQFSIIAGGLSIVFAIFMTPLPDAFKYPTMISIALISVAAGLLKINGMTLDTWLITFIGAIYSPTQFIWEKAVRASFLTLKFELKNPKVKVEEVKERVRISPNFFEETDQDEKEKAFISTLNFGMPVPQHIMDTLSPRVREEYQIPLEEEPYLGPDLEEGFEMLPEEKPTVEPSDSDLGEEPKLTESPEIKKEGSIEKSPEEREELVKLYEKTEERTAPRVEQKVEVITGEKRIQKPVYRKEESKDFPQMALKKRSPSEMKIENRKTISLEPKQGVQKALASEINLSETVISVPRGEEGPRYRERISNLKVNRAIRKLDINASNIFPIKGEKVFGISEKLRKRLEAEDMQIKNLEVLQINENPEAPELPQILEVAKPEPIIPKTNKEDISGASQEVEKKKDLPFPLKPKDQGEKQNLAQAKFVVGIKDFNPPQIPNTIAGIIKDQNQKVVSNVIVLIKDDSDIPARALKSNKLGQFEIITPLENGVYSIEFEKQGCQFETIRLELKGEIIPLVEVICKNNA